jgi:hypothetical protein
VRFAGPVRAAFHLGFLAIAIFGHPAETAAQSASTRRRAATPAEVLGGNILVGGLTAATRALLSSKNPFKAFGVGALGGAVHLAGKNIAVEPGTLRGWLGLAIAGAGASMVSNGGRGVNAFEEVSIPVMAARIRLTPRGANKVRLAINGFEAATLINAAFTDELRIDWSRSASNGVVVFITDQRIVFDGGEFAGVAEAPVVIVGASATDTSRIVRHELVHVHQDWFLQEVWGRPVEDLIRRRLPGARFIPRWLELGAAVPAFLTLEKALPGRSGLRGVTEAEAERLERR